MRVKRRSKGTNSSEQAVFLFRTIIEYSTSLLKLKLEPTQHIPPSILLFSSFMFTGLADVHTHPHPHPGRIAWSFSGDRNSTLGKHSSNRVRAEMIRLGLKVVQLRQWGRSIPAGLKTSRNTNFPRKARSRRTWNPRLTTMMSERWSFTTTTTFTTASITTVNITTSTIITFTIIIIPTPTD